MYRPPIQVGFLRATFFNHISPEERIYLLDLKPGGKCYATT